LIKLRVNELAGEFGITSEELMTMLRSMDVPVRSHLSQLSDEQIARTIVTATIHRRDDEADRASVASSRSRSGRVRGFLGGDYLPSFVLAAVIVLLTFMYEIAAWRKSYSTTVTNAPTGARVGQPHAA